MKEKEKNIYGIHQYTLTRRRKVRGKKSKGTSNVALFAVCTERYLIV
jgi:hypothetical protein